VNLADREQSSGYLAHLKHRETSDIPRLWDLLDCVMDPEIPVLSLWDLGVLRNIVDDHGTIVISLTPTYTGCPAMDVMREDLQSVLYENGYKNVRFETCLSPAWSSDFISLQGREKMQQYGIAPPNPDYCAGTCSSSKPVVSIACPHCGSKHTKQVSEFGSTACKALHQCLSCLEPFDYFKSI